MPNEIVCVCGDPRCDCTCKVRPHSCEHGNVVPLRTPLAMCMSRHPAGRGRAR